MENDKPLAGDTVHNEDGQLPESNPNHNENGNADKPTQGNGDGANSFISEAEQLLEEAREEAKQEKIAREKAEKKIVEMKRASSEDGGLAKVVADLQTKLDETLKKSEEDRKEDRESMKVVVAKLLEKNKEAGELKAALSAGKANLPNISSQNIPADKPQKQYSQADIAIAKHFKVKLD